VVYRPRFPLWDFHHLFLSADCFSLFTPGLQVYIFSMPSPPSHNMHSQTQALKIFFTNETPVRMTLLSMDPTYEELQVMIHRQGQYDDTKQNITYWDGEDWCRCQADEGKQINRKQEASGWSTTWTS